MRSRLRLAAVVALVLAPARQTAWATIDNLKAYKQAYPGKDAKAYSCKICHQGALGKKTDLNAYGKALKQFKGAGSSGKLRADDYRGFEAADLDGDGATNAEELEAGTDPLDSRATPSVESQPAGAEAPSAPEASGQPAAPAPAESAEPDAGPGASLPSQVHASRLRAYLRSLVMPAAWAQSAGDAPAQTDQPDATETEPVTVKAAGQTAAADYVGSESCAGCHAKEFQEFSHSTHARISIPGQIRAQGCESCHGPGSLHVEAGGGRGVGGIVNPSKDPTSCFACHLEKKAEFRQAFHHPVLEGKLSCADCHNPHGREVRPWSSTTMAAMNDACFQCHKEQRGPFVWEHEALREGCTTCHKVHGSIHDKMLLARDNNLCLRCHTQANFPVIGKSSHGGRLPQGTCFSAGCHTAVHGSNFDDHLRY